MQAVVAPHKLVLQDAGILRPDVVEVVPLRLDLKALGVLLGVDLAVDKGKLDVDRGVQIVVEIAQVFKDGRLGVGLCKLIADVGKLDTLAERVGRHLANPVRVHGLIGMLSCAEWGFAVALILADDGLYFLLFGAGELYRRFFRRSFLCFLDNGIYLLFHLLLPHKGRIGVVGLVGPLLRLDEAALDDLPYHHFKGLAVALIQGQQEARQHGEHHNQRRRAGGDAAPEQKKSGTPTRSAPPKQISCRFVRPNTILDFTRVKSLGTVT